MNKSIFPNYKEDIKYEFQKYVNYLYQKNKGIADDKIEYYNMYHGDVSKIGSVIDLHYLNNENVFNKIYEGSLKKLELKESESSINKAITCFAGFKKTSWYDYNSLLFKNFTMKNFKLKYPNLVKKVAKKTKKIKKLIKNKNVSTNKKLIMPIKKNIITNITNISLKKTKKELEIYYLNY